MVNNFVLEYSKWNSIHESAQPDAVYLKIDFLSNLDVYSLMEKAIRSALSKYSEIFKLDEVTPTEFTISLNVDDELGSLLTDLAGLAPITFKLGRFSFTYSALANAIASVFPMISSNEKQKIYTYILTGAATNYNIDQIVSKTLDSQAFSKLSNLSTNHMSFEKAEAYILDRENSEEVFFKPKEKTKEYVDFKSALLTVIYHQLLIELISESARLTRKEITLSDFSDQIDTKLKGFGQKIKDYYANPSKDFAREIIMDIAKFQSELGQMLNTADVRRHIASKAIVKTYSLFQQMGFSGTDALELIKT